MQSQLMAVLATARGESVIYEHIFENRFRTAGELQKMGADIQIKNNRAVIRGVRKLKGCHVSAKDLRGGAALVIAGPVSYTHLDVYKRQIYNCVTGNY